MFALIILSKNYTSLCSGVPVMDTTGLGGMFFYEFLPFHTAYQVYFHWESSLPIPLLFSNFG